MVQFKDARLKVKRANKHITDLKDAIIVLKKSETSVVQLNSETGHKELIHAIEFRESADDLALIAGDAIHNLRTALDFAWVSILKKHVPSANLDYASFPVRASRQSVIDVINGININSTSHSAIYDILLNTIQPHEGGMNGVVYSLHRLDITDKHILLLGLLPQAGITGIVVLKPDGEIVRGFGGTTDNLPPYVIPFERNIRIQNEGKLTFNIVLQDADIYNSVEIIEALTKFSQVVLHYVELLENL
jgi:hypothetical protein